MSATTKSRTPPPSPSHARKRAVQLTIYSLPTLCESASRSQRARAQELSRNVGDAPTENERRMLTEQSRRAQGNAFALWSLRNSGHNLLAKLDAKNAEASVLIEARDKLQIELEVAQDALKAALVKGGRDAGKSERQVVAQLENALDMIAHGWRRDGGMSWAVPPQLEALLLANFEYHRAPCLRDLESTIVTLENALQQLVAKAQPILAELAAQKG